MRNFKFSNTTFISLIISSIIPFLIIGPFFPDLIVSISSLLFMFFVFRNNNFYYFNHKSFILFLLFCSYCIICSLESETKLFSLKSSFFYFRIGIFSCFIWYLIDKDPRILTYFYYSLILCFLALIIDGYYQYFFGKNILGFEISRGKRVSSFFGDELIMGSYLSRLFPLLFALFLKKKKKRKKKSPEIYFIGSLFILADVLIFMSGERTAFFFLNLSTIFIIILIKEYQKFRLITFIIAMICVAILSFNFSTHTKRMIINPAKDMGIMNSTKPSNSNIIISKKPVIFSINHDSHIKTAYKMYKDRSILGHGPKTFRLKCSNPKYATGKKPCSSHPHNFYVQLLAETGILGFSFLFAVFCYVLYCGYSQIKSIILKHKRPLTDYQICLLAGILITVWPFTPNGSFFNNWLIIVYSLPVGFYLQSIYPKKK